MPSSPGCFRLIFLLPAGAAAESGEALPSADGCAIGVHDVGLVEVFGPSRQAVFDCAARFLRIACRGLGQLSIASQLETPDSPILRHTWADGWNIIVGADVAFSPTPIGAHFPKQSLPPPLAVVTGRAR